MMKTKVILFDFDGTLADTRANIVLGMQEAMRETGLPVADENAIAATIGLPAEQGYLVLLPDIPQSQIDRCVAAYRVIFERNLKTMFPKLFPHVKETLAELKGLGYILTIASSRKYGSLTRFLDSMGIAEHISYALGADSVTYTKPHPEPVQKTLADLHFAPEEALVVGDMPVDIQMGRNAGARTCAVTYGNASRETLERTGTDFIIDDFSMLLSVMTSMDD